MQIAINDKKILVKAISAQFGIKELYWLETIFYYMIDSSLRTSKRLDLFLKDQIDNPDPQLVKITNQLRTNDIDETIINILKFVKNSTKYKYDIDNYKSSEYWATAKETLNNKAGDCDDINSLIYILARLCDIPPYVIYCCIGDVFGGGHFWLVYWSCRHDKLVAIDGTYYTDLTPIKDRKVFKLEDTKYIDIWYAFTDSMIYKYVNKKEAS